MRRIATVWNDRGSGAPDGADRTRPLRASTRGRWAPLLAPLLALGATAFAGRAGASDILDPVAGEAKLRELEAAGELRPLASGELNADHGGVAVLEYTGEAPYQRTAPDGSPNIGPRAAVSQRFFAGHGESYDFLVVFSGFEFDTGATPSFFTPVRNDVRGIGKGLFDLGRYFGSPGRLKGYVDMGPLERLESAGFSLDPSAPGFQKTLNAVAHQVGHQWLAGVRYRNGAGALSSDLVDATGPHWSYALDSDGSVAGGADWVEEASGGFRASRVQATYSALDLYLMGLLEPDRVGPIRLLRGTGPAPGAFPSEGDRLGGPVETVEVAQIRAPEAEGPRLPDSLASPKSFRLGFVLLVQPGTSPDLVSSWAGQLEGVRRAFASHFFSRTRGLAVADTGLAEGPLPPLTVTPDLERALAWLVGQQRLDGRFEDAPSTGLRDTQAVAEALARAGLSSELAFARALLWARAASPLNFDFFARRASTLALGALGEGEQSALRAALSLRQNGDGGFGPAPGYASSALDTALALRAWKALGQPIDLSVRRAVAALRVRQLPGGGFPVVPGGDVSTLVTAHAALALQDWDDLPEAALLAGEALPALLQAQNSDGGFGQSPSSTHATALALQALVRAGAPAAFVDPPTVWLANRQLVDGSFEGSAYQTALVLAALRASLAPNLVVDPDDLAIDPARPQEGETATVTAVVRNRGRGPAEASTARLYDGAPGVGTEVGAAPVPALAADGEAPVVFGYETAGRAGARTLFVVADAAGEVEEAREDDNAASRALTVEGLLPDLALAPGDVVIAPYPPAEGEVARVLVTVRNGGEREASPTVLRLFLGDPQAGGALIGQADVGALAPGASQLVDLAWDTTGALGTATLVAVADAAFAVAEHDESNNRAARSVEVTGPPPSEPDLAVESLAVDPPRIATLPLQVTVRAVVRNRGLERAAAAVELVGAPGPRPLVDLGSREAAALTFTVDVASPGPRTFVVVADPDGLLAEADEANNRAEVVLEDPGDSIDLEIRPGDLELSATSLTIGQDLTITVPVRNRGTRFAPPGPVAFYRVREDGLELLDQRTLSVTEASAATVEFQTTATEIGDAIAFAVIADPEAVLEEVSETNNRVDFSVRVAGSDLPNLAPVPGSLAVEPDPPAEDAPARVAVSVRNESPSVPAGPFVIRLSVVAEAGEATIAEVPAAGLGPLESTTIAYDWPLVPEGAVSLAAVVDPAGGVPEYEERDNRAELALGTLGMADLVLTTAGITLEPGAPRVGEPVRILANVRNQGGQPAGPSAIRAYEGDPGAALIQEAAVPGLAPGAEAVVELAWIPEEPIGARVISFLVDPEDVVREGDDGNNLARRTVLVQDADLFFSDLYFSPNGDGTKDETTFGYRVGSAASAVAVRDAEGREVRRFAGLASSSDSLTWDGRDGSGLVVPDGPYTFDVESDVGAPLGSAGVIVDTNRTSLFASERPDEIRAGRVCGLPVNSSAHVSALPTEDAVLLLVRSPFEGLRPGLVRVSFRGERVQVLADSWFAEGSDWVAFASAEAVSPDGREVLVTKADALVAVDLASGARRPLGAAGTARWSPDGRSIVVEAWDGGGEARVLTAAGAAGALLTGPDRWAWSPDGEWLAAGNRVVRRDGSGQRDIPLEVLACEPDEYNCQLQYRGTVWRSDGKVSTKLEKLEENDGFTCEEAAALLIDPVAGTYETLGFLSDCATSPPTWSPDGTKLLYHSSSYRNGDLGPTWMARPDGSGLLKVSDALLSATPRGAAAYGIEPFCLVSATTLRNLTVVLDAVPLPDEAGILVRGTVADQNLESFQLEYAPAGAPESWRPLGPASDLPFVDDTLTVWVPPAPGSYWLRLRAHDLAGNARAVTQLVAWQPSSLALPALADITQDAFIISPNADLRSDTVTFNFRVLKRARIHVRVAGPKSSPRAAAPGATVDAFVLDPEAVGPDSFLWGREGLPDGRYTVFINDLAYRLDLDSTAPSVTFRYTSLRAQPDRRGQQGVVVANRDWQVSDANLREWRVAGGGKVETGDWQAPRPGDASVNQADEKVAWLGTDEAAFIEASDRAGNITRQAIAPVEERLFLLDVRAGGCGPSLIAPIDSNKLVALKPGTRFRLGETIRRGSPDETVRFQYQPRGGGAWSSSPSFPLGDGWFDWTADFDSLGVPRDVDLRGRFVTGSGLESESFLFSVRMGSTCESFVGLNVEELEVSGGQQRFRVSVLTASPEPLDLDDLRVTVTTQGRAGGAQRVLDIGQDQTLLVTTPAASCDPATAQSVEFNLGFSGPSGICTDLSRRFPRCSHSIEVAQAFKACGEGTPGALYVSVAGATDASGIVSISIGSNEVASFGVTAGSFSRELVLGTSGLGEGAIDIAARLRSALGTLLAEDEAKGFVDRTPPVTAILLPAEGAASCALADASGREHINLVLESTDASPSSLVRRERRDESGAWSPWACEAFGTCPVATFKAAPPPRDPASVAWDVTGLPEGEQAARLTVCDQSGFTRSVERRVVLVRRPPALVLDAVPGRAFSPNGDGRLEIVTVIARLFQDVSLDAEVRRAADGQLVRQLVEGRQAGAPESVLTWDGRADGGGLVPDGEYVLVVTVRDGCGRATEARTRLEVDTVPPAAAIVQPGGGDNVSATVDVRGFVSDAHLEAYELLAGAGSAPTEWVRVRENPYGVPGTVVAPGLLGRWDAPAEEGPYVLRLVARDTAGNETPDGPATRVLVNVGTRAFLARLRASPEVFSPSAPSPANQATITFALARRGRVFAEVRDLVGGTVRGLLGPGGAVFDPGPDHVLAWDGTQTLGGPAEDGDYRVWVRVEDEAAPASAEEREAALTLDRTPPAVVVASPALGAHVRASDVVAGSILDPHLAEYVITATGSAGAVELGRGRDGRTAADLAPLASLADGAYTLSVDARDTASNRRVVDVPFVVDALPPSALLLTPVEGAVLDPSTGPLALTGTVTEANLEEWVVRVGAGASPSVLDPVARGTTTGAAISLSTWGIGSLPDGLYTLVLEARDRAGNVAEVVRRVSIDREAPTAAFTLPADGSAIGATTPVTGTAADAHLDSWTLEAAPGPRESAFAWAAFGGGSTSVTGGPLGTWPLPPDGVHTLRLTVLDRAGHTSTATSTVTVDTVAPAQAPADLQADVTAGTGAAVAAAAARGRGAAAASEPSGPRVTLRWTRSADPDVAGYRVFRNGLLLTPEPRTEAVFVDAAPTEGQTVRYAVVAEDRAGNRGPEATIVVRVDTTPPLAALLRPEPGAPLSGPVTVFGSAWSTDDFKAYRLFVGASEERASWTLLRQSSLPVLAGPLGELLAQGDGARLLVLEAEDVSGNVSRATVPVAFDNVAPAAPVLTGVVEEFPTYVTVAWEPGGSPDVDGYLVYRNGRLVNAEGLLSADLRSYLLLGSPYTDVFVPDGRQCWTVVAMDRAGNLSSPSTPGCLDLDNRPPQAQIVSPRGSTRFETAIPVVAASPDADLASVVFEVRPASGGSYAPLGPADLESPFEAILDPQALGLASGPYALRARATDHGGRSDPDPVPITVVYGDTTAPGAPQGLVARVDGASVRLSWTAATEADLAGYLVYRDGQPHVTGLTAPEFVDAGLLPGRREYHVAAIDQEGNESPVSASAEALVYAVTLDHQFPVTLGAAATLSGSGARAEAPVQIDREGTVVAEVSGAIDRFGAANVPLLGGTNVLRARGRDALGNTSIPSDELVLISNTPPPALTGLEAVVDGNEVALSWAPVGDPDLQGYLVRRDGELLTAAIPVREVASFEGEAVSPAFAAPNAFDEDTGTVWIPPPGPGRSWTVHFPSRVLVSAVTLDFAYGYSGGVFPSFVDTYRIEAQHEGRFVPLFRVTGNGHSSPRHELPTAFATDALRVVMAGDGFHGLAEVRVEALDAVASSLTSFRDVEAPEGRRRYRVSAVDRYGFEGEAGEVAPGVGDVEPPSAPTGLAAVVTGSDVALSWDPAPEPVDHYRVVRDGEEIGPATASGFTDAGRPNGVYRYVVLAVDAAGNVSLPSNEAEAIVDAPRPAAPALRGASTKSGHAVLDWDHDGAPSYTVLRSASAGGPYDLVAQTGDTRTHRDRQVAAGLDYFYVVRATDGLGNDSADSNEVRVRPERTLPPAVPAILGPTRPGAKHTLASPETVVSGRADADSVVLLERDGTPAGEAVPVPDARRFEAVGRVEVPEAYSPVLVAPDGRTLALATVDAGARPRLALLDAELGSLTPVAAGEEGGAIALAFSPDGRRLAYAALSGPPASSRIVELVIATGAERLLDETLELVQEGSWSESGTLVYVGVPDIGSAQLHVVDVEAGSSRVAWATADGSPRSPRLRPDGGTVALRLDSAAGAEILLVDVESGLETRLPDTVAEQAVPAWSPDGRFLAYSSSATGPTRIRTFEPASGALVDVTDGFLDVADPRFDPRESFLTYTQTFDGLAEVRAVDLATGAVEPVLPPFAPDSFGWPLPLNEWTRDGRLLLAGAGEASFFQAHDASFEIPSVHLAPGENVVAARATLVAPSLASDPSAAIHLEVPESVVPDLVVDAASVRSYPSVARVGLPVSLSALVRNDATGSAAASFTALTVTDAASGNVLRFTAALGALAAGGSSTVTTAWTPAAPGVYRLVAEADAGDRLAERREDNNSAAREIRVTPAEDVYATISSDRALYGANTPAFVRVTVVNGGASLSGRLETAVEDTEGREVARVDSRPLALAYGESREWALSWATGVTYAGSYRFRTVVLDASGAERARSVADFEIVGETSVEAQLAPERPVVDEGEPTLLHVRVQNQSLNVPLVGYTARVRIVPAAGGAATFAADLPLDALAPLGAFSAEVAWPVAGPPGDYAAGLVVARGAEAPVAEADATLAVAAASRGLAGTLALAPSRLLPGQPFEARVTVTNRDAETVHGRTFAVEVQSGGDFSVLARATATVDIGPLSALDVVLPLDAPLVPGFYPVYLVTDGRPSLARATLRVHGPIAPPSVDAPADGARVPTANPVLRVNNATSADGEPLTYEFQLFADAALAEPLLAESDLPEGALRTEWRVPYALPEDSRVYWRARATDGFSSSAWTAVSSFTVDETNRPPTSPVLYRPLAGARVASLQPSLVVANGFDPEREPLVYEFQIAADAEMTVVIASAAGVAEGPAQTSWTVPVTLDDNTRYYWRARASDGEATSPWMDVSAFRVDLANDPPTAPLILRPEDGQEVGTATPTLAVGNASDPDGDPLSYRFEIFREGEGLPVQVSPEVPEGAGETSYTPAPLDDNTPYLWRAAANDGDLVGPAAEARFFVNLGNEAPGAPTPLAPADGQIVATSTPTLVVRNAVDPDRDPLTYEFEVKDAAGTVVASASGVAAGVHETAWTVSVALGENQSFTWTVRARDDEGLAGPRSAPQGFRVNAVVEPPTAPTLVAPADGAVLEAAPPVLVVANATSPEGLALTYTFELFASGVATPIERAEGVLPGATETSWTPTVALPDGSYEWRARAVDSEGRAGAWMATAHFQLAVDQPPAPPQGLEARAGDGSVALSWTASPETDVAGYRVYRGLVSGGPYELVAAPTSPAYEDLGLTNGVTVYYVVTALDARFESAPSGEAAATPSAEPSVIPADVRIVPDRLPAECLFASCTTGVQVSPLCLPWLFVAVELPAGRDPLTIDPESLRLAGSIRPDHTYRLILDLDFDGRSELWIRFALGDVVPVLHVGANVLALTATAGADAVRGETTLVVGPLEPELMVTPKKVSLRSANLVIETRLTFASCLRASDVDVSSILLNGQVPVDRVVSVLGSRLTVRFAGNALRAVLRPGKQALRVTGMLGGQPFVAEGEITVTE